MRTSRAENYAEKEHKILEAAGTLFANSGYPFVKMEDIAQRCKIKKSTLYHYFSTKDEILCAIINEHMDNLLLAVENAVAQNESPEDVFQSLLEAYTLKSTQSRRRHLVTINDLKFLPNKYKKSVIERQKKVVELIAQALGQLNEDYPKEYLKFYAMLLIGMLNWTDTWYKPSGVVPPDQLCERIARLFISEIQND